MIRQPKFKVCRRLGPGVYEKCQSQKFTLSEARKAKATRGKRPKALSDYGSQLREKQKIRLSYGVSEKQFAKYIDSATAVKGITPTIKLLENLESRLDNLVYRVGLAPTRVQGRQMVSHGHFIVNGHRTTVPSYNLKIGDEISVREGSRGKALFVNVEKKLKNLVIPAWIKFDVTKMIAKVIGKPKEFDSMFDPNAVLEFYSR